MPVRLALGVGVAIVFGGMLCAALGDEPAFPDLHEETELVFKTPASVPQAPTELEDNPRPASPAIRRLPSISPAPSAASGDGSPDHLETLEQAWAVALKVDQRLQSRRWEVSAAQQSLAAARAQRWPTVGIEGSYVARSAEPAFKFNLDDLPLPTNRFPYSQDENAAFGAKADLPIYTSGHIRSAIDAASADVTASFLAIQESARDLKLRVAEEYVMVLRAQRRLEVAETTSRSLQSHARDVDLLFQHDRAPRNDLLAAQVALSNARQDTIRARNLLDSSRAAYNRRLGRRLTSPVRLAELPVEVVEEDVESLTRIALAKRVEIDRLSAQIRALRHRAASLKAKNRPQVKIRTAYTFEENRFQSPEGIASLGVGASWNLFDGGRYRHEATALLQRAEGLSRLLVDLKSSIALEVRQAWLDVQETSRRLEVNQEACQWADENLRVAKKRYSVGAAINTEVLDAEKLRTQAYRNHHNAKYDAALAVLRLRHATGQLLG